MKKRRQPTPPQPTQRSNYFRYAMYALVLLVGVAIRWGWSSPQIPQIDLEKTEPGVALAIGAAEAEIRQSPRSAPAWGQLGLLLLAHSYFPESQTCLERAAELDRGNWRWPYLVAYLQNRHRPDQAVAALERAIACDSTAALPQLRRAELLYSLGREADAEDGFQKLLRSPSHGAGASLGLARIYVARGELKAALEVLEPARQDARTRKSATALLVQIRQRQGNEPAIRQELQRLADLPPDEPWPDDPWAMPFQALRADKSGAISWASHLDEQGQTDQSLRQLQNVERRYPEVYCLVEARNLLAAGHAAEAETLLRKSLQHDPASVEARLELGNALAKQEQTSAAEAAYRQLLKQEPGYGPAYLALARCQRQKRSREALTSLRLAVQYLPQSAEAHQELADLLAELGDVEEAAQHRAYASQLRVSGAKGDR
jgi:tetratricopeptide (TPR) repeat protein